MKFRPCLHSGYGLMPEVKKNGFNLLQTKDSGILANTLNKYILCKLKNEEYDYKIMPITLYLCEITIDNKRLSFLLLRVFLKLRSW